MKWWKKYGALILAGVLVVGACAQGGTLMGRNAASAEETEETQRTTLNIVSDGADTVSADETETVEPTSADDTGDTEETAAETVDTEETEESERVTLNIGGSDSSVENDEADLDDADAQDDTDEASFDEDAQADESETVSGDSDAAETQLGGGSDMETTETASGSIVTTDVSEIIENCMPSIVTVTCVSEEEVSEDADSEYYYYYDADGSIVLEEADDAAAEQETTASGIIIAVSDTELLIATNYHVVSGASDLTVGFSTEAEDASDLTVSARVKGSNSGYDLAVVAVELSDIEESVLSQLKVATLGSSADLKTGQAAVVLSDSGYGMVATVGIISAQNLTATVNDTSMDVIMTDAADGAGSGGALLNASGEVVGICVADESGDQPDGVGYAIPIDTAIPVLEQLVNKETRDKLSDDERGYIGATVVTVSEEAAGSYNMPAGAFVYEVTEGSAADEAGIKSGDIISAFAGESVSSSDELIEKMSYYAPGETVTLEVQTANNGSYEAREVEVTLQEGSSSGASSSGTDDQTEDETEEDFSAEDEIFSDDDTAGGKGGSRENTPDDDSDGEDSDGRDFSDGFDDGFDDGFEDYNSQFN